MSATEAARRIPLAEAVDLATDLIGVLGPYCERIEACGSIRRKCHRVGDVELVLRPRLESAGENLLGESSGQVNLLLRRLQELLGRGVLEPHLNGDGRQAIGPKHQRVLYRGFPVDVYAVIGEDQWGVVQAIRTGPAEFSKRLVTPKYAGGLLQIGQRIRENQLWDRGRVTATPEENDLFEAIGCPWIEPERREACCAQR